MFCQWILRNYFYQGWYYYMQIGDRTFHQRLAVVYHQFQRNCISSTRSVVSHQAAEHTAFGWWYTPAAMIYECISRRRRVIHSMIYQACGLDKKIRKLSFRIFWSGLRGSNPPPPPWQGGALPNELNPHIMVPRVGIEPTTRRFSVYCSTNWATEAFFFFKKSGDPKGARTPDL